jgi:opacity protein-like surface antigen
VRRAAVDPAYQRAQEQAMKRTSIGILGIAIILGAAASPRIASADDLRGVFVGGNFGRSRNDYDVNALDGQYRQVAVNAGDTLTFTSTPLQRNGNAWWVDAGDMVWPFVGIEAAFVHLGELTHRASGTLKSTAANDPITTTASLSSVGPALALVFRVPLAEAVDVNLRVGDYLGKSTLRTALDINSVYTPGTQGSRSSSLLAGLGVAYTFAGHWSLRLDYLRINKAGDGKTVDHFNVNLASAGVAFTF